jgi:nitroimidazol reductase NimA-like FMN-containing flavoprotein (pyridoxamine 5'-phosphate oxidase superfamily)
MRRHEKEVADPGAILDVLARGDVLHLAMIAEHGAPYVVPLSYAAVPPCDGDPLRILVHSAPEGRKIEALRRDPRVSFEITVDVALVRAEKACEFGARFRSVIGSGRARFVEDSAEKARALSLLAARYGAAPGAVSEADARKVALIEIRVAEACCKVSPAPNT